jgi:hypothetical protein
LVLFLKRATNYVTIYDSDEGVSVTIPFEGVLVDTPTVKLVIRNGYGSSEFCFDSCVVLFCFAFMPQITLFHVPDSLVIVLVEFVWLQ